MPLTDHIALGPLNLADLESTTFGGHSDPAFPTTNLAEPDLEQPWRTADAAADRNIQFNFDAPRSWQLIFLVHNNFNTATSVKVEKSDNGSAWTEVAAAVGPQTWGDLRISQEVRQKWAYLADEVQTSKHVRLVLSGGTALSYYEAFRAYVGPIIQPDFNMQYGMRMRLMTGSTQQRASQGGRIDTAARDWRRMDFEFVHTDEAEVFDAWLAQIYARIGRTGSMPVIPRPTDPTRWPWENLWAAIAEDEGVSISGYNYWRSKFSVEERII